MKSRGLFCALSLVLVATLLLAACTPSDDAQPTSAPEASGQTGSGSGDDSQSAAVATLAPTAVAGKATVEPDDDDDDDDLSAMMADIPGYRAEMTTSMSDGETSYSSETVITYVADPLSWSMTMTGEGMETETRYIDGTMYTRTGDSWTAMTIGDDEAADYVGVLSTAEWSDEMDDACEDLGKERINGFSTRHYRCDMGMLEAMAAEIDDDDGTIITEGDYEVWLSDEYGIAIQTNWDMATTNPDGTTGTWQYSQTILEISDDFDIEVPDNIESSMDMSGNVPDDYDFPVMDGATDFFDMMGMSGYSVAVPVADVAEFYDGAMKADGWELDADSSMPDFGSYVWTKDGANVTIMLGEDTDANLSTVMIIAE